MPVTLRSLQERNNALKGQSHGIFIKHLLIGLEIGKKYYLQNESFLQGKYHLACHFIFLTARKKPDEVSFVREMIVFTIGICF